MRVVNPFNFYYFNIRLSNIPALIKTCLLIFTFFTVLNTGFGQATNINGVINSYFKIIEVIPAKNCVRVSDATGLSQNDKVMLVQMKGASINTTNTSSFGDITSINNAGNYEINQVCRINEDSVFFTYTILNDYTPTGKVQLVKIPVYTDAIVTDTLKAAPWDNATGLGGVVAIQVTGELTLNAPVSAIGAGFKGGSFVKDDGGCSNFFPITSYYSNAGISPTQPGGFKGEGVYDITSNNQSGGRGALANGGGGGNNHNNSGGGGANLTIGGAGGGNSSTTGCQGNYYGHGGKALNASGGQKIYLGGGGGAGHANNTTVSTGGGNGGGIIFILAGTIVGNNQKVISNGKAGGNTTGDGASGGGAGGTIIMNVTTYSGSLTIEANGGQGGNENNEMIDRRCYGGGGGGSGGAIYFNNIPSVGYTVSGGINGSIINSLNCPSLINGTPGNAGQTFTNYNFNASNTLANFCGIILPVELISFTAKNLINKTNIQWEVNNTEEIEKFDVEHSLNGMNWKHIHTAYSNGSSNYQYLYDNIQPGYHFYRLKMFKKNGNRDYSNIAKVFIGKKSKYSVYPNPAKEDVFVSGEFKPFSIIQLVDISGKIVLSQKITDHNMVQRVPTTEIPPGVYLLKLEDQVQKIIIY